MLKDIILTKLAEAWKDEFHGGAADKKKPSDFNQRELKKGIGVEKEHTNNKHLATEIAMDHLEELKGKHYYTELLKMEERLKKKKR